MKQAPAPQPVDLAAESVAGEEDPGASLELPVPDAARRAGKPAAAVSPTQGGGPAAVDKPDVSRPPTR